MSGLNRNAPCSCGSGLKFKRCCLPRLQELAAPPRPTDRVEAASECNRAILRWLERDRGLTPDDMLADLPDEVLDEHSVPFWLDLEIYRRPELGRPRASHYLESARHPVHPEECQSRLSGWVTIVEVIGTRPAEAIVVLEDLLVRERLEVRDVMASRSLPTGAVALVHLGLRGDEPFLSSGYPRALEPADGAEALAQARKAAKLGVRKKVTREMLRDWNTVGVLALNFAWAAEWLLRPQEPVLQNTDGEPLILSAEHFAFREADRAALLEAIARIEGVQAPEPDDEDDVGATSFTVLRDGSNTVVGRFVVAPRGGRLTLETNSENRANILRGALLAACGDLVTHRGRELQDVHALLERERAKRDSKSRSGSASASKRGRGGSGIPREEELRLLRELKERHYATWPDHGVPALGGLTPRQAASGTPKQRAALEVLLKDMEFSENRMPAEERYDFGRIRAELGMPRRA